MNINFKDKVVVITGASQGIGQNIAINFAKNKATVILLSRNNNKLKILTSKINKNGGESNYFSTDVSNFIDFNDTINKILKNYGKIDVLVNNAGITKDNLILRMKENDWDTVINTNLKGCFNGIKSVSKNMISNKKGRIINIVSIVGIIGNKGQSNYSASKAGIIGLTKSIAKEFASRNITVNAIAPGYINTEMTNSLTENIKNEYINKIPLQRFGTPEDISNLTLFLSSDFAEYITGQIISVDGGMYM